MSDPLILALRPLQLPAESGYEGNADEAVREVLTGSGVAGEDHVEHASLLIDEWLASGGPPTGLLLACARAAIRAGMPHTEGDRLAQRYPTLIEELDSLSLAVSIALGVISQAPLAYRLATTERMSATQVAIMLSQRLGGTYIPWKAIQRLLAAMRLSPQLDESDVIATISMDAQAAEGRLTDADLGEAAERVGAMATRLGFPGDAEELLRRLCPSSDPGETHIPYLQVLDYQCLIVEFFDHPPTYLYEFTPRGQLAVSYFNRFPPSLAPAGNPILNNFKAVDAANYGWARSRPPQAHALVDFLRSMAAMPFPARHEIARWIRQWIDHVVLLTDAGVAQFPTDIVTDSLVAKLMEFVSTANTGTYGVVEQRAVDAFTSAIHPTKSGWRSRGIGDAVNAANLPRRKLGDSDFQRPDERVVIAYEPHGGRLSRPYLLAHQKSLARVVEARLEEEWLGIADADEWSATVRFVAHDFDLDTLEPLRDTLWGVRVAVEFMTFDELARDVQAHAAPDAIREAVERYFLAALNRRQTPQRIRDTVATALGMQLVSP
jgi:hypothetical protein